MLQDIRNRIKQELIDTHIYLLNPFLLCYICSGTYTIVCLVLYVCSAK